MRGGIREETEGMRGGIREETKGMRGGIKEETEGIRRREESERRTQRGEEGTGNSRRRRGGGVCVCFRSGQPSRQTSYKTTSAAVYYLYTHGQGEEHPLLALQHL